MSIRIKSVARICAALTGTCLLVFFGIYYQTKNGDFFQSAEKQCVHPPGGTLSFRPGRPATKTVTVVTAYYDIPSKLPRSGYLKHMENFLPKIPCNLYIFTDRADYAALYELRKPYLQQTKFIIKEFSELQEAKRMEVWKEQHEMDHENAYHTPELYVVWQEKIRMVMEVINENAFNSEYFIWCDIGSFRSTGFSQNLTSFPDYNRTAAVLKNETKMTLLLLEDFSVGSYLIWPNGLPLRNFRYVDRVGAGIMAGHRRAWNIWSCLYYDTQELLLRHGRFAGKEQTVMASVVVKYPDYFNFVSPRPYFEGTGDAWFYLQFYFSRSYSDQSVQR